MARLSMRMVALLGVAWLLSACGGEKTPQETATAFWGSVIEQDAADAVDYSTLTAIHEYDGFSRDWRGFQPTWGRLVIDGEEASIVTRLDRPDSPNEPPIELVTYLVREDEQWKVDYARTDQAMRSPLAGLLGRFDRLGQKISDRFKVASDDLEVEMERLGEQFEQLSDSLGRQASDRIEQYGAAMRRSIDELAESVDRALREAELSDQDKRVLNEVSADLNAESDRLSRPTAQSIANTSRTVAAAREQLRSVDDPSMESYQAQWREWGERVEADMRRMIDELPTSLSGSQGGNS